MKFVVSIFGHPEFYPPTLNALRELSKNADEIFLLGRNVRPTEWKYPENVNVILTGHFMTVKKVQEANFFLKFLFFFQFTIKFYKLLIRHRPEWVLCYDAIPLLSFRIARLFISSPPKLWYHNHDVMKMEDMKKFSVGWMAVRSEKNFFNKVDIFSLPALERKQFFPLHKLKGVLFHLPNFPSTTFYKQFNSKREVLDELNLLYQGTICKDHGIEELMDFISKSNQKIKLSLIGNIESNYKEKLISLSKKLGIEEDVKLYKPVSYAELPKITANAHVGIAVNIPENIMYATGGTASNKIYEYAAVGLPIFYYDNEHYKKHLSKFKWAIPTDLSTEQLSKQIEFIKKDYKNLSEAALKDFESDLNFENSFKPLLAFINANEN